MRAPLAGFEMIIICRPSASLANNLERGKRRKFAGLLVAVAARRLAWLRGEARRKFAESSKKSGQTLAFARAKRERKNKEQISSRALISLRSSNQIQPH